MLKPDLLPLTGGYRRTPVMQVGADIFCDTLIILRQIERMHPSPSLFPEGCESLATMLGWGIEKSVFVSAIGVVVGLTGQNYPRELVEDRLPFFGFSLEHADMLPQQALFVNRLNAHLTWLGGLLSDGRTFLLGSAPSAADLCAYHPLWHLRRAGGVPTCSGCSPGWTASPRSGTAGRETCPPPRRSRSPRLGRRRNPTTTPPRLG
jgi:glutathione S-transferase